MLIAGLAVNIVAVALDNGLLQFLLFVVGIACCWRACSCWSEAVSVSPGRLMPEKGGGKWRA